MNSFENPMSSAPEGAEKSSNPEQEQFQPPGEETLKNTKEEFDRIYGEFWKEKSQGKTAGYSNLDDIAAELEKFEKSFEIIFSSEEDGGGINQNQEKIETMQNAVSDLEDNIEKAEGMVGELEGQKEEAQRKEEKQQLEDVIKSFEKQIGKAREASEALKNMFTS